MALCLSLGLLAVLTTVLGSTNAQTTAAAGALGGSCSEAQPCSNQDYVCFNNTCALKAGAGCANNLNSCVTGSSCKVNQCTCNDNLIQFWDGSCVPFVALGGACSRFDVCHNQPDPSLKLACVSDKCLIQVNQSCADNTDKCVTGAECQNGLCKCKQGYFDWDKNQEQKCRRHAKIGTDCSDGADCVSDANGPDLTCDPYKLTCVIKEGKACDSTSQMFCPTGSTCQSAVCTCLAPYHHDKGACSETIGNVGGVCGHEDMCKNDSLNLSMDCDRFSGHCLLKVGQPCQSYPDGCMTGAVCSNATNTCVCSGSYTTSESGSSCRGPQGHVGGQCNTGNACSDSTSSTCSDGYCLCKTGHTFIATNSSCVAGGGSGNGNHGNHGGNAGGRGHSVVPGMLSVLVLSLSSLLR